MSKCPISYEDCGPDLYSSKGLRALSPKLKHLEVLPYTAQEQRQEAVARVKKISIQGVQPKLSAKLEVRAGRFKIVNKKGTYIIKPQSDIYQQLPENEDVTMKMAALIGIEVPQTGLIYSKDKSLSYFIKRFDRYGRGQKYHQEDFAQLTSNTRDTKYNWSMERLVPVLDYCTFPKLERLKLFRRTLFCFVTGNENMHLKNFSLIYRNRKIGLSPAYDLINTTIVLTSPTDELALPLAGKKSKLSRDLLLQYWGKERLALNEKSLEKELEKLFQARAKFEEILSKSFLNPALQKAYSQLLTERYERLEV